MAAAEDRIVADVLRLLARAEARHEAERAALAAELALERQQSAALKHQLHLTASREVEAKVLLAHAEQAAQQLRADLALARARSAVTSPTPTPTLPPPETPRPPPPIDLAAELLLAPPPPAPALFPARTPAPPTRKPSALPRASSTRAPSLAAAPGGATQARPDPLMLSVLSLMTDREARLFEAAMARQERGE